MDIIVLNVEDNSSFYAKIIFTDNMYSQQCIEFPKESVETSLFYIFGRIND